VLSLPKGNRVISFAPNKFRNSPWIDCNNATVHAEVAAIRAASDRDLRGSTIYVSRVAKDGHTALARPCKNCMIAITEAGIKEIIYTNNLGGISIERVLL
jgi:deoxycytidylate deaminase